MTTETLAPPSTDLRPAQWVRRNLFSGLASSIVTVVIAAALVWLAVNIGQWAVTEARWDVVTRNLRLFLIGQYPADQAWRLWLSLLILSVLAGISAGIYGHTIRVLAISVSAIQALLAAVMLVSTVGPLITLGMVANAALVWVGWVIGLRRLVPRRTRPLSA